MQVLDSFFDFFFMAKNFQDNAEWRDNTRHKNMKKAIEDNEKEEEEERDKKAPSFIRFVSIIIQLK